MEDKLEYWNECLKKALDYTKRRYEWEFMSVEEKTEADNEGIDNSWRQMLGEERQRIGDFACFITYITGIGNR